MNGHKEPAPPQNFATFDAVKPTMPSLKVSALVLIVPLLASCASSGLYNMSDEWCAAHVNASAARCPEHHERVAANDVRRAD